MNFLGNYRTKTLSGLERKRWQRRHQVKSLNAHVHDATDQVEDVARLPMLSAPVVRIVSDLRIPVDYHGVAFHDPFYWRFTVDLPIVGTKRNVDDSDRVVKVDDASVFLSVALAETHLLKSI